MARTKKFRKRTKEDAIEMYIKANRKGSRQAELESENGFTAKHKTHKSKKTYNRKSKHKSKCA
jgi:hypothetical protein